MKINTRTKQSLLLWNSAHSDSYRDEQAVSNFRKDKNEKCILEFSGKMKSILNKQTFNGEGNGLFKRSISIMMKEVFEFTDNELSLILNNEFASVTKKFISMARDFDPNISTENIFQASRNLWIASTLQLLFNKPVELTKSLFAYSMLYPYTDNYIDNPHVRESEKYVFSERFRMRLSGVLLKPLNQHEKQIFALLEYIESEWDRQLFPDVYESLLAIHAAQTRSIKLTRKIAEQSENELLKICIEKGGTSVLADGYLIHGFLTPEQESFCFDFGVLLQFVDDIQDLQEDIDDKIETIFTYLAHNGLLDCYINKILSFTQKVMDNTGIFDEELFMHFKSLVLRSVKILTAESVCLNTKFFSEKYVNKVEEQSSLSFRFIQKYRNKISGNRVSIMQKITPLIDRKIAVAI